jgi:hypothetical protein
MQTFDGRVIDPFKPDPAQIDIVWVAHHLALENRYGGATRVPLSVAEHSYHVSRFVPPEYALEAHLHDTGEAVSGDIIWPIKHRLTDREIEQIEAGWHAAVLERFGVVSTPASRAAVKAVDTRICLDEVSALLARPDLYFASGRYEGMAPLGINMRRPFGWRRAKRVFLRRFKKLMRARG